MKENYQAQILLAMVIWGSIGIFRRWIPLSSELLAFARGVIGFLFMLWWGKRSGRVCFARLSQRQLGVLLVSGACMGINWILLFETYKYTSVSAATLCYYMQPTILILLSPLLFQESLTKKSCLVAGCALAGMVLVSGIAESGGRNPGEMKGVLLALGAAFLYALVVILNKKLQEVDGYQRTWIQVASSAAVLFPYLLIGHAFSFEGCSLSVVLPVLLVGIVHTGIAYALYFGAIGHVRAQTTALLSYADPVSALLLAALLLGERLSLLQLAGALLILGSAYLAEKQSG